MTKKVDIPIPAKETTQKPVVISNKIIKTNTESPTQESTTKEPEAAVQTTEPKDKFSTAGTAVLERTAGVTATETISNKVKEIFGGKSTTDSKHPGIDTTSTKKPLKTTGTNLGYLL